jgi:hypothetical protein
MAVRRSVANDWWVNDLLEDCGGCLERISEKTRNKILKTHRQCTGLRQ